MPETVNSAEAVQEIAEDTMHGKFLALYLDEQRYAIPIDFVVDIIQVQPITRVPNCPDFVAGITNLRGKAIPIVDLRVRFGKMSKDHNDRTCIIVLEDAGATVGLIVDGVSVVLDLADDEISPPPSFNQGLDSKFIQGVGRGEDGITLIMDCKAVLDENRFLAEDEDEEDYE